MDRWGKYKTPCPNCNGKVEWWSFSSDCRGNPGSGGIQCLGSCKRTFTYNEWEIIAKKEMQERRRQEKEFWDKDRQESIKSYNENLKKNRKKKKRRK